MNAHILAAVAGLLFGLGLAISQMVDPNKVLGFLDISGKWDPSLLLVIGAATGLTMISFRWVLKKSQPLFSDSFRLPTKTDIDKNLVIGAILFGVGWGLAGYCPGPGIAALTLGTAEPIIFVVCLIVGSRLQKYVSANQRQN